MTSNKWYHRWIYQQAKKEVNMPEHRPKREIRMPSTYYVQIKYIGSNALACAGTSESTLPLSDCGKFFMVSGTDENGEFYVVSFPVSPGTYVVAKKI